MVIVSRPCFGLIVLVCSSLAAAETPVQVGSAQSRAIAREVEVSGTVTSPRSALLSTAVAGLIAELKVDEGDRVEQGQTLLTLDPELAQLAVERAMAEVQQRDAELADAKRRLSQAETVGPERGIARTEIESLRAEVLADQAVLAAARVAVAEGRAVALRHTVKAPFDGVISQRTAELGEWVNPGDGLFQLVATQGLRFDFQMGQDFYPQLELGMAMEISLDSAPGQVFPGKVSAIVPVSAPGARTFLVRATAADAAPGSLAWVTPGMSVNGRLGMGSGRSGVVVSRDALLRYPDGRVTVFLVDGSAPGREGSATVREQVVAIGMEFDGVAEILDGLAAGDAVVVRGNESLQDGQTVTIVDE